MILSDGHITESEIMAVKRYAIASGLKDKHFDGLIYLIIKGIRENKTEDSLLSAINNMILKD